MRAHAAEHWIDPVHLLMPWPHTRLVGVSPGLDHAAFSLRCLQLAAGLKAGQHRRVALSFDDAVEMAIALLACWRAGVTAVIPGDLLPATCLRIDGDVDLWLSDATLPVNPDRTRHIDALLDAAPLIPCALGNMGEGVVLNTSGSSGVPKQVVKSWAHLASEIRTLAYHWPAAATASVLGSVSAHHMFGLPFRVLWPLCAGHAIDRAQRHYPEALASASFGHARLIWITTPALLRRLGEHFPWDTLSQRLEAIYTAGGPLPAPVSDDILRHTGKRPIEIYGSTETGTIAFKQGAAAWQALDRAQVGANAAGSLWVSSPWTGEEPVQTADLATFDTHGFQLLGREDRIVKIEEKRVSLRAVELALEQHPFVADVHVGQRNDMPRLVALIGLTRTGLHALRNQGRQAFIQALQHHLASIVEPAAIPRRWRMLTAIPWNAQSKLPRNVFDALSGARPTLPAFGAWTEQESGTWVSSFEVPPDLAQFSGHFPSTPVVPGVVQIGWALAASAQRGMPLAVANMENLKFQRLLRPGDQAELALSWDAPRKKLSFAIRHQGAPCSSGRLIHDEEHAHA